MLQISEVQHIMKRQRFLTIKQAKSVRCTELKNTYCSWFHYTCRRCGLHVENDLTGNRKRLLCPECNKDYDNWHIETYVKPQVELWDSLTDDEREMAIEDGMDSPLRVPAKIGIFVRTYPIIDIEAIDSDNPEKRNGEQK